MLNTGLDLFGAWRGIVDEALSIESLESSVEKGSYPTLAFSFMLVCSSMIATLGLLANSAAVIIGAMIVAPLMTPILSMSFGIVAGK